MTNLTVALTVAGKAQLSVSSPAPNGMTVVQYECMNRVNTGDLNRTTINFNIKDIVTSYNYALFHQDVSVFYDITIEGKIVTNCPSFGILAGRILKKGFVHNVSTHVKIYAKI